MRRSLLLPLFLALPTLEPAHAGTGDTFADAREVIERRCLSCHGGDHRESGLCGAESLCRPSQVVFFVPDTNVSCN